MITKDADLTLMKIILACLFVLVCSVVYYQYTFSDVYNQYETQSSILNEKIQDISYYREILGNAKEDIEISYEREEAWETQFKQLKDAKIIEYQQNVKEMSNELLDEKTKTQNAYKELEYYENLVGELEDEIDDLEDDIKRLKVENRKLMGL